MISALYPLRGVSFGVTRLCWRICLAAAGVLVWQGLSAAGAPDPTAAHTSPGVAILDIAVLVFREGLECILVLSAVTASLVGQSQPQRRPIAAGAGIAFVATLITWFIATGIVKDLSQSISALNLQAATGLLAVVVLLVVMNWFFHKIYWGGWVSMHNRKKKSLLSSSGGAAAGVLLSGMVAVLTFVAHQKLPYRKMLILTGVMLGVVLLVMVGEQAQEMQLAGWIPNTPIPALTRVIPAWAGLWFSVFPNLETLAAQLLAAMLVIGSYFAARLLKKFGRRGN